MLIEMPLIKVHTLIHAPIERVFDLARSIDLHSLSTSDTNEKAIAGRTTGLIEEGESVTWEATHFGVRQQLTSHIPEVKYPFYFRDEMLKGAFKSIYHEHFFEQKEQYTLMTDSFRYEAPLGILGDLANVLFLKRYMKSFLVKRNECIKQYAESEDWKTVLK